MKIAFRILLVCIPVFSSVAPIVSGADKNPKNPSTRVTAPPHAPPRPDLRVWVHGDGAVTFNNAGAVPNPNGFKIKLTCDVLRSGRPPATCGPNFQNGVYEKTIMTTLSPSKAGDFYHSPCQESGAGMVCAAFHDLKHGTFKLSALIDSENAVSETNEKNNSAEATVVKP